MRPLTSLWPVNLRSRFYFLVLIFSEHQQRAGQFDPKSNPIQNVFAVSEFKTILKRLNEVTKRTCARTRRSLLGAALAFI